MRRFATALTVLFALIACKGDDDTPTETGTTDSAGEFHPNVPPGYEYKWPNTDGCGDDDSDTQVYMLAEGSTDADGNLTLTETWYWFFGDGWENDCVDVIEYTGTALTAANLTNLDASEAEEGYIATMKKTDDGCPGMNYLYLWDHPDKDDFEYGDGLNQGAVVIFDTLTPSGNLNFENAMLVFMGYDVDSGYSMDYSYARGVFTPDSEDVLSPPASYSWDTEKCLGSS